MESIRGVAASPGLVVGPARVWRRRPPLLDRARNRPLQPDAERARLAEALSASREGLLALRQQLEEKLGEEHARILDAQILILDDPDFLATVHRGIDEQGLSAEMAFTRAMAEALIPLDLSEDAVFRARIADFRDVEQRVVRALLGDDSPVPRLESDVILVTDQLTPSETAALDLQHVLGFCVDQGGDLGHTAILARSLGVPAIVGLGYASRRIADGVQLALDGTAGWVHVQPDTDTLSRFRVRIARRRRAEERLLKLKGFPAETPDGRRVELSANVELPQEVDLAVAHGAQGIGLVRTEYFFFQHPRIPSEQEQFEYYRSMVVEIGEGPVIFRALDAGGDKLIASMGGVREYNPFLGLRGTRFLLSQPEILRTQLRALYRTSAFGRIRIMFPMVSDLEEMRALRAHAASVLEELQGEGVACDPDVEIGIMIETPAAVLLAPELARECDFFSLGTNDLTQYVLAVDRTNHRVAGLARAQHPAVLRAIARTVEAAHAAGIWVGCCGEMGSNPMHAVLLLGMSLDEISVSAASVPLIKKVIRTVRYDQAKSWAAQVLKMSTVSEVDSFLFARAHERLRDFLDAEGGNGS